MILFQLRRLFVLSAMIFLASPSMAADDLMARGTAMIVEADEIARSKDGRPMNAVELVAAFTDHSFTLIEHDVVGSIHFGKTEVTAHAGDLNFTGDWIIDKGHLCFRPKGEPYYACKTIYAVTGGYAEDRITAYIPN